MARNGDQRYKPPSTTAQPQSSGPPAFQGTPEWWEGQKERDKAYSGSQPANTSQPPNPWGQPPPAPPAPNASGHRQTTSPHGMDQTMPGVAEQNWEYNQDRWFQSPQLDWASSQLPQFGTPGYGEQYNQQQMGQYGKPGEGQQYWDGISGQFNEIGQYNQPNLAAESYQRTVQNLPGSIQPTFDSAFDRARDKSIGAANQQASARGSYGSSAALNGVNSVITDIEAQRANRHGDFALQDSANQRNWLDSAANQGRSADLSGLGMFGANLEGTKTFSDMAFRAEDSDLARDRFASDTAFGIQDAAENRTGTGIDYAMGIDGAELNRTNSGFNASVASQNARDNRVQGGLDYTRNMQNDMTDFLSNQFENVFNGDQEQFQQWMDSVMGVTQNNKNDNQFNNERMMRDAQAVGDIVNGQKQAGG